MSTSPAALKALIQQLIRDTIAEQALTQNQTQNERGTVVKINDDGTVDVQTSNGAIYNCGTPIQRTKGTMVVVVTADGQKVAV